MSEPPEDARAANEVANTCIDERRFVDAIGPAERAAALAPAWADPWNNLVVAYKHARRWQDCLDAADRRLAIDPDHADGVHWNAGIAATALGHWALARRCWTALGIELPPGEGPIAMKLGPTPVRVGTSPAEVVWTARLDPCRARIESVPTPETGRRCGDVVLHDGEPRGRRRLGERLVPVFDELDLLERSPLGTWEVVVAAHDAAARDRLVTELEGWDRATTVEDWTENVRTLCKACSEGVPEDEHDHDAPDAAGGWQAERTLGIAAKDESMLKPLRRLLGGWRREVRTVRRVL